jgi:predicted amidohydrolase YtcJ
MPRYGQATLIRVIENARIYTLDRETPRAEAIAIQDGRILAVGSREEMRSLGGEVRRVDVGGRAVIPGLIDAHIHLLDYSRSLVRVNLDGVASKEEALSMVAETARQVAAGGWVRGGGWNNNLWSPPDFPSRYDLDRVAPDNPVFLDRKDLHSVWLNSEALRRAGITRDTPDPPGAAIGRDEAGEPNGMLFEIAVLLARDAIDEAPEDAATALRRGFDALIAMGITGVHVPEGPETFGTLQVLDYGEVLPMRVIMLLPINRLKEAIALGLRTGFGSDMLRVGPVKIFSDGSLGSQTAEMLEPYEGNPSNMGIGTTPQEELERHILEAARAGISSAVHAIGDAANRRVLGAFRKAREVVHTDSESSPLIHRIEHAQLLHPDDIPRFAALGVVASMQPIHATSDMHAADRLWGHRSRYSYAWRSVLASGGVLAFGSDAPVETPDPFAGIHAAVTRQDADDQPEGGWYPEERLTVEQAVRAYTEGAAQSAPYLPGVTGTLSPGSAADLLVLDRDIFEVPPSGTRRVRPLVTMVGGRACFDPEGMFPE